MLITQPDIAFKQMAIHQGTARLHPRTMDRVSMAEGDTAYSAIDGVRKATDGENVDKVCECRMVCQTYQIRNALRAHLIIDNNRARTGR